MTFSLDFKGLTTMFRTSSLVAVLALTAAASSFAAPITPEGAFGPLPVATFGGTGIPNNAVQVTTVRGNVLGLTATPRFSGPAVANDGVGTFFALSGPSATNVAYAGWNFGFYISPSTAAANTGTTFQLLYDFNPAVGNDQATHGVVSFGALTAVTQNSWNLGMGFLANPSTPGITVPTGSFTPFDPNAMGEYTFSLIAIGQDGFEIGRSAIGVSVVPEPGTYALMLAGLGSIGFLAHRRRRTVE